MEADSTTCEKTFPFSITSSNYKLYQELTTINSNDRIESHIVQKLQSIGLLPATVRCTSNHPECQLVCKPARVIDRVQWVCVSCRRRLPIRYGTFFLRLQCSLLQALQMILAWCEDADLISAATWFGVIPRVAALIFDKLDDIAIHEHNKRKLGGKGSVVLSEMYPDCMNRLSPDSTDQPIEHKILMLADTSHVPTLYKLVVLKDDIKKQQFSMDNQANHLRLAIEEAISQSTEPGSSLVTGANVPPIGSSSIQKLAPNCDRELQHFLMWRVWRQAVSLCTASRDLCEASQASSRVAVQRYLQTSLYRLTHGDGFYGHMLNIIASHFTQHANMT